MQGCNPSAERRASSERVRSGSACRFSWPESGQSRGLADGAPKPIQQSTKGRSRDFDCIRRQHGLVNPLGAAANQDVARATEVLRANGNLGGLAATAATGGDLQAGQAAPTVTNVLALAQTSQTAYASSGIMRSSVPSTVRGLRGIVAPRSEQPEAAMPQLPRFCGTENCP